MQEETYKGWVVQTGDFGIVSIIDPQTWDDWTETFNSVEDAKAAIDQVGEYDPEGW